MTFDLNEQFDDIETDADLEESAAETMLAECEGQECSTKNTEKNEKNNEKNNEKAEKLTADEQKAFDSIQQAFKTGDVLALQKAVGSILNNQDSLMKVARALQNSMGDPLTTVSAQVTRTSSGGYSASLTFGRRDSFAKSAPYTELRLGTDGTTTDEHGTRPIAWATHYASPFREPQSMQPENAMAYIARTPKDEKKK